VDGPELPVPAGAIPQSDVRRASIRFTTLVLLCGAIFAIGWSMGHSSRPRRVRHKVAQYRLC
jgi:hypothetical protein